MFTLDNHMIFIQINQTYLKALHNACSEVFYKPNMYDNKPYIGILVNNNNRKYVIPLSSAKEKHKSWKNVSSDRYLIYEFVQQSAMRKNDIWVPNLHGDAKHILSAIDLKKMIPVADGTYSLVNINKEPNDTAAEKSYKDLLTKEYKFCNSIIQDIIIKASKIYDKQMKTSKVTKFCCDFKALESVADSWGKSQPDEI
ncbi:type III toxin-antitoxin system ToxN/AbiQ family toxin [Anaerovoracaceae bacterium 42-11]